MRFLLKYASRSRPALFQKRVRNWQSTASGKHQLAWLCSFDRDDPAMNNPVIHAWCNSQGIAHFYGQSRNKVQAINADMDQAPAQWDVVVMVSDDMAVIARGWDEVVAQDFHKHFPDLNGALWYLDGRRTDLCTLSILGRPVYRELGYLYCPEYYTSYCDNDFQAVMEHSGRMRKIDVPLFRHEWRQENNDALMTRNEGREWYAHDKAVFDRRLPEIMAGRLLR